MNKRILIMGLPGSGKTTLSRDLVDKLKIKGLTVEYLNADEIRTSFNDWDFSTEGRIRQSLRMRNLSNLFDCDFVVADFVAPLVEMRKIYEADITIWVDTISESKYEDTNSMFIKPETYDFRVTEQDSEKWSNIILGEILSFPYSSVKP